MNKTIKSRTKEKKINTITHRKKILRMDTETTSIIFCQSMKVHR
uniref:Uncharacterized protein n=1 Tax=Arundo donax TaxID=35708 RepID=A0A0A9FDP1_ARUDO